MGKLKLSDVRKELPFKTHQVNLFFNIGCVIRDKYNIDYDVYLPTKGINLQRPFCWTIEQKQQLILSVIKEIYIPKVAILVDATTDERRYEIIDGKQRLNALFSFIQNAFPLKVNERDYYFDDFDEKLRLVIKGYSPVCQAAYFYPESPITDADKIAWFEQINFAGTPQDIQHLNLLKQ